MDKKMVAKLAKEFKDTYAGYDAKQTAYKGVPSIRVIEECVHSYEGYYATHDYTGKEVPDTSLENVSKFISRVEQAEADAQEFAAAHGGNVIVINSDTTEPTYRQEDWDKVYNSKMQLVGGMPAVKRLMARYFKPNGTCRDVRMCVRIVF